MKTTKQRIAQAALAASGALLFVVGAARADEGGVSFWAPGQFSSFAAVPGEPGWAVPVVYYHLSADAGGSKSFLRGGVLTAGFDGQRGLTLFFPTYSFKEQGVGGQCGLLDGLWGAPYS